MLLDRYRTALGKSEPRQSLYDHTMAVVDVMLRVAALVGEPPGPRLDRLVFGSVAHDVGKLSRDFQAMLEAAANKRPLPAKRVKHEACTFDHDHVQLVADSKEAVRDELRRGVVVRDQGSRGKTSTFSYPLDLSSLDEQAMEHVWAFAVSHHGYFYVSYERTDTGVEVPRVRRQWTTCSPKEVRRMTLVDLLFEYHPLGGLVILADQIASHCHQTRKDYTEVFGRATSLGELIEQLMVHAPEIEASLQQYDPRDYGLRDLLTLLRGGL